MSENNENIQKEENLDNLDSSNIFNDFIDDENLIKEVEQIKTEEEKDLFYYILKISSFLQFLFWLLLVSSIVLFLYIQIQNNAELSDNQLLDPFCFMFTWEIEKPDDVYYCSSVAHLKNRYNNDLNTTKDTYKNQILTILQKVYEIDNFSNTKEVLFLLDKTKNKAKVLSILEEFDNLKKDFDPNYDKEKVLCKWLVINSDEKTLSMTCSAYSWGYEKWIRWLNWEWEDRTKLLKGTSLSIANSFINYIEKTSDTFDVVNKQKMFKSEAIIAEKTGFTNKTVFNLELIYNIN
jgi:hypothetical protein